MKKLLIIVLLSIKSFSQENKILVEYNVYYNTYSPRIKTSYLSIIDNHKSQYIELPNNVVINDKKNDANFDDVNLSFEQKSNLNEIKINLISKRIESIETMFMNNTIYKVMENLPKIIWNINFNETKQIGEFKCNKGMAYFRGRNYTVWYTNEIPVGFGPWKLFGAPGLIIEAFDETMKYRWQINKINKMNKDFEILSSKIKYDEEILLKDFIEKKYGERKDIKILEKSMKSKLPRGAKLEIKTNKELQDRELIFEWEEK